VTIETIGLKVAPHSPRSPALGVVFLLVLYNLKKYIKGINSTCDGDVQTAK
jgi:hypothetical protein